MTQLEWWMLSPSPFSLLFFSILTILGAKRLKNNYLGHSWLNALTDSFFIMAFVVVCLDLFWSIASMLRFIWWFQDSFWQITFVILRDVAGILFTSLFVLHHFKNGTLTLNHKTSFYLGVNMLFLMAWFGFASSPAWTDWTYAIRYDFPMSTIIASFLISHLLGKSLVALCWNSLWN